MSQTSSPARPVEPPRDPSIQPASPAPRPAQEPPNQLWKLVALAAALAILAALLFYVFVGPTSEQSTAPVEKQAAEEEEEAEEPPAAAPAPPPPSEDPRPYPRPSSHSSGDNSAAPPITLPPLHVLSVGYSPMPAFRVVALRIGSALPYFMHEGDTIGDIKILAILHDRVQISHKGKTYEIKVGADGTPIGMPLR